MTSRAPSVLRTDIQALRALAVALVVLGHLWPDVLSGGYVGVDVFFVISGFLITSHLLAQASADGRVSLLRFWGNRAIRILPAAILVLGFCAIGTLAVVPRAFWQQFLREIIGATLYAENWVLAVDAADYWAANNSASPVRHYWSLSVEEQFYIVMPLVLVAALRSKRRWRLWYGAALSVIGLASFAHSISLTSDNGSAAYFVTSTRVWEFASGSFLALVVRPVARAMATPMACLGLAMILGCGVLYSEHTSFPGFMAAIPVIGTVLVIWAHDTTSVLRLIYDAKPVRLLGDVSYAIYLWHWPLLVFSAFIWSGDMELMGRLALIALTILIAWLSTRFFEDRIRFELVSKPRGRRLALVGIALGMFGLFAPSAAAWVHLEHRPRPARAAQPVGACFGAGAMVTPGCPPAEQMIPGPVEFVKDDGNRVGCWATTGVTEPLHCTLGSSQTPTIRAAAIGDSHSNGLIPAYEYLAETLGWSIDVYGKNGCYLTTAKLYEGMGNAKNKQQHAECLAWRENLDGALRRKPPYDLILVTHWEGSFLPNTEEGREEEAAGLVEAWKGQIARGAKIVAITDSPTYPTDVIACIAKHALEAASLCGSPRARALPRTDSNTRAASLLDEAVVVDTRRYFCTESECLAIIGGVPVLFDRHHVSATFARSMGPLLVDDITRAMVELGLAAPTPRRAARPGDGE